MSDSCPIRFENVTFGYEDEAVIHGLSFEVVPHTTKVILGGSGSGKSTVLKLILGLVCPDSGRVFVGDNEVSAIGERELQKVRRRIGMVFQGGALFDSLTVGENIAYTRLEHGREKHHEVHDDVVELLEFLNLPADTIDHLPDTLSGGMARRVAIGRAVMAGSPEVMLYDEPTTGLDPITTVRITELINKLKDERGVCSIVVTHQLIDALEVADDFMMLSSGRKVFEGSADELLRSSDAAVIEFLRPFRDSLRRLRAGVAPE